MSLESGSCTLIWVTEAKGNYFFFTLKYLCHNLYSLGLLEIEFVCLFACFCNKPEFEDLVKTSNLNVFGGGRGQNFGLKCGAAFFKLISLCYVF